MSVEMSGGVVIAHIKQNGEIAPSKVSDFHEFRTLINENDV